MLRSLRAFKWFVPLSYVLQLVSPMYLSFFSFRKCLWHISLPLIHLRPQVILSVVFLLPFLYLWQRLSYFFHILIILRVVSYKIYIILVTTPIPAILTTLFTDRNKYFTFLLLAYLSKNIWPQYHCTVQYYYHSITVH